MHWQGNFDKQQNEKNFVERNLDLETIEAP
jgi:hypothetical protein